ncbi:MAG: hypothetical protein HZA91_17250 [Verrucomicrobia bacterium]|nr:hypothetical protein [Verrucomicrobiota bacterium]
MKTISAFSKPCLVAAAALLVMAGVARADTEAEQRADAKAGLLSHPWRVFKLPTRGQPDWPEQVRVGPPPYPQQPAKAQASPPIVAPAAGPNQPGP